MTSMWLLMSIIIQTNTTLAARRPNNFPPTKQPRQQGDYIWNRHALKGTRSFNLALSLTSSPHIIQIIHKKMKSLADILPQLETSVLRFINNIKRAHLLRFVWPYAPIGAARYDDDYGVWSIRGQTHDWPHHHKFSFFFPSVFYNGRKFRELR